MTTSHPDLDTFRDFRDQKILKHRLGKYFVSFYYRVGPDIASCIAGKPNVRRLVRHFLGFIAQYLRAK